MRRINRQGIVSQLDCQFPRADLSFVINAGIDRDSWKAGLARRRVKMPFRSDTISAVIRE